MLGRPAIVKAGLHREGNPTNRVEKEPDRAHIWKNVLQLRTNCKKEGISFSVCNFWVFFYIQFLTQEGKK